MNVAFIPVRGGSKSIPLKNIKVMADRPLVYWTVKAASDSENIDFVYVSTDNALIKDTVEGFGLNKVKVVGRSEETALDNASTESAMLEFAENNSFDNIILIQATSPLLSTEDIDRGFGEYNKIGVDSVLSVVRQKRFHWQIGANGYAEASNYDYFRRPRRQDFDGYFVENGAFYITSKRLLLQSKNRLSGNIAMVEMEAASYFEIDEPADWVIVEALLREKMGKNLDRIVPEIKMFLMDCDGTLTDAGMYYSENGDELKKFNTRDGVGIARLRDEGIITGIITGEDRALNKRRALKLKVDELVSAATDKVAEIKKLCDKYHVSPGNVAFIGDDVNDLEAIRFVGLGAAVNDADNQLKNCADYVTENKGGQGAVREFAEYVLNSRGGQNA